MLRQGQESEWSETGETDHNFDPFLLKNTNDKENNNNSYFYRGRLGVKPTIIPVHALSLCSKQHYARAHSLMHFLVEKTEAQRDYVICPRSCSL